MREKTIILQYYASLLDVRNLLSDVQKVINLAKVFVSNDHSASLVSVAGLTPNRHVEFFDNLRINSTHTVIAVSMIGVFSSSPPTLSAWQLNRPNTKIAI